jgi:16S rRNA (guanine527-N7)-methyltransferase
MKIDILDSDLISDYITLLMRWNQIHKLTNYRTDRAVKENILDSIYPIKFLDSNIKTALDIGSGAGFPAIFLAMSMPDVEFTLLEPLIKKFSFLSFIVSELELKNIKVLKNRVEELEDMKFDLITSRAVSDTQKMIELSKPLIDKSSTILLYKGSSEESLDITHRRYKNQNRTYLLIKGEECLN